MKGCSEDFPFDETTLVMKVGGKMFALINLDEDSSLNLKCNPEEALALRETYNAVLPGYHMNKKHWNTIIIDGTIDDDLIRQWIGNSYFLVARNLTIKQQQEIGL